MVGAVRPLARDTILLLAVSAACVSGCALFRDPNAAVAVDLDKSKAVLTQADKRAILVLNETSGVHTCLEPSPDVKADVDAAVRALAAASASMPDEMSATAKAELDATRRIVTAALLQRSQGLQVLRDMLFQACLAVFRGDMSPIQYNHFVTVTLPRLTTTLIAAEMVMRQDGGKPVLTGKDLEVFLNFMILNQQ